MTDEFSRQSPFEQRETPHVPVRAYFRTAIPSEDCYPDEFAGSNEIAFSAELLSGVEYPETVGIQSRSGTATGVFLIVHSVAWMPPGTVFIAEKVNGQWHADTQHLSTAFSTQSAIGTTRKYDIDGKLLWTRDHGDPQSNPFLPDVESVTLDNQFNVYTGGMPLNSPDKISTRKYNKCGELQWSASSREDEIQSSSGLVRSVSVNQEGTMLYASGTFVPIQGKNVYVRVYDASTGNLLDSLSNFLPQSSGANGIRIAWNSNGLFESVSTSNGEFLQKRQLSDLQVATWWQRPGHSSSGGRAIDIAVNSAQGFVYACGLATLSSPNSTIEKYQPTGGLVWAKKHSTIASAALVAVSQTDGFVYAGGNDVGGSIALFQLKESDGSKIWSVDMTQYLGSPSDGIRSISSIPGRVALTTSRVNAQDTIFVFDDAGTLLWSTDHGGDTWDCAFEPTGSLVIVGNHVE